MKFRAVAGLLILVMMIGSAPLGAVERMPQLSLEELSNPKSRSYVPIPFPKTNEEIITDLEYAIKRMYTPRENTKYYGEPSPGKKVFKKFLEGELPLKTGAITKVYSRIRHRSDYFLVIDSLDEQGQINARILLEDNGLHAGNTYPFEGKKFAPLLTIEDVANLTSKSSNPLIKNVKIKKIRYEAFYGSYLDFPELRVETEKMILYISQRKQIFKILGRKKFETTRKFVKFMSQERRMNKKKSYYFLFDELQAEHYLTEELK